MRVFLFFLSLLFSAVIYADGSSSYYCINTYQLVKIGDTADTVRTACGAPTTTTTEEKQISTPVTFTRWTYTLGHKLIKGVWFYLPSLIIIFNDQQQVTQIEQNGAAIAVGSYCAINNMVNIGDTKDSVLLACGRPDFINTRQEAATSTKTITRWTYNNGPYKPQMLFDFEDGKLSTITTGP